MVTLSTKAREKINALIPIITVNVVFKNFCLAIFCPNILINKLHHELRFLEVYVEMICFFFQKKCYLNKGRGELQNIKVFGQFSKVIVQVLSPGQCEHHRFQDIQSFLQQLFCRK